MVTATFALICSDMSVQGSPGGEVKGSEKRIGNGRLIRLRRNKGGPAKFAFEETADNC